MRPSQKQTIINVEHHSHLRQEPRSLSTLADTPGWHLNPSVSNRMGQKSNLKVWAGPLSQKALETALPVCSKVWELWGFVVTSL